MIWSFHPAGTSWAGPPPAWLVLHTARPTSAHMHTSVDSCPLLLQADTVQHYTPVQGEQARKNILAQCFADQSSTASNETKLWKSNLKQLQTTNSPSTPQNLEGALLALKTIRTRDPHDLLIELSRRIMPVKISKLISLNCGGLVVIIRLSLQFKQNKEQRMIV